PGPRPLLEGGDHGVLGQLLGHAHVAHDPGQAPDEPGRLDVEDRVDRAMDVIGGRHATDHTIIAGSRQGGRARPEGDEGPEARLSEVDAEPDQDPQGDLDEDRVADPPGGEDGAAHVPGQQDGAQDAGRRDQVHGRARQLQQAERDHRHPAQLQVGEPLLQLGAALELHGRAEHEQRTDQGRDDPSRPHALLAHFFSPMPDCARQRSSRSRTSGVSASPKSPVSKTCRISTSSPFSKGARFSHSMASSFDFTCHSQNPATSSLVSAKGPSITVRFCGPSNRTRAPLELAWSPSPASMTPALISSSLYLPMAVSIFSSGSAPPSESLLALTITMNRMSLSPLLSGAASRRRAGLLSLARTLATNEESGNRHALYSTQGRPRSH